MDRYAYVFCFDEHSDVLLIRKALDQAMIATRALHGEFMVGVTAAFRFSARKRRLVIHGITEVNSNLAKILSAFIQQVPELHCTVRLRRLPRRPAQREAV